MLQCFTETFEEWLKKNNFVENYSGKSVFENTSSEFHERVLAPAYKQLTGYPDTDKIVCAQLIDPLDVIVKDDACYKAVLEDSTINRVSLAKYLKNDFTLEDYYKDPNEYRDVDYQRAKKLGCSLKEVAGLESAISIDTRQDVFTYLENKDFLDKYATQYRTEYFECLKAGMQSTDLAKLPVTRIRELLNRPEGVSLTSYAVILSLVDHFSQRIDVYHRWEDTFYIAVVSSGSVVFFDKQECSNAWLKNLKAIIRPYARATVKCKNGILFIYVSYGASVEDTCYLEKYTLPEKFDWKEYTTKYYLDNCGCLPENCPLIDAFIICTVADVSKEPYWLLVSISPQRNRVLQRGGNWNNTIIELLTGQSFTSSIQSIVCDGETICAADLLQSSIKLISYKDGILEVQRV